jgi:hypothetical protein
MLYVVLCRGGQSASGHGRDRGRDNTLDFALWVVDVVKVAPDKAGWERTRQGRGLIIFPCEKERRKATGLIRA